MLREVEGRVWKDGGVAGLGRASRAVLKKVTGVLVGARDEAPPADDPAEDDTSPVPEQQPLQEDDTVTPAPPDVHGQASDEDVEVVEPDPRCAEAVELARAVAVEVAGVTVGDHLGVEAEPDAGGGHVLTHSFATTDPAYVGWRWAVTVARADGADEVTVDEVVLLPGTVHVERVLEAGAAAAVDADPQHRARGLRRHDLVDPAGGALG